MAGDPDHPVGRRHDRHLGPQARGMPASASRRRFAAARRRPGRAGRRAAATNRQRAQIPGAHGHAARLRRRRALRTPAPRASRSARGPARSARPARRGARGGCQGPAGLLEGGDRALAQVGDGARRAGEQGEGALDGAPAAAPAGSPASATRRSSSRRMAGGSAARAAAERPPSSAGGGAQPASTSGPSSPASSRRRSAKAATWASAAGCTAARPDQPRPAPARGRTRGRRWRDRDRRDAPLAAPGAGLRGGGAQQWADEVVAARGHPERPRAPGAAREAEEHGLGLVGGGVARRHAVVPAVLGDSAGRRQARVPGPLLHARTGLEGRGGEVRREPHRAGSRDHRRRLAADSGRSPWSTVSTPTGPSWSSARTCMRRVESAPRTPSRAPARPAQPVAAAVFSDAVRGWRARPDYGLARAELRRSRRVAAGSARRTPSARPGSSSSRNTVAGSPVTPNVAAVFLAPVDAEVEVHAVLARSPGSPRARR